MNGDWCFDKLSTGMVLRCCSERSSYDRASKDEFGCYATVGIECDNMGCKMYDVSETEYKCMGVSVEQ